MKLTVVSKHPIAEMEKWIHEKFEPVLNNNVVLPDYTSLGGHPFTKTELG